MEDDYTIVTTWPVERSITVHAPPPPDTSLKVTVNHAPETEQANYRIRQL